MLNKNQFMKNLFSIEDIEDEYVRNRLQELTKKEYLLGIQINGSRATGFAQPKADWDGFLYVTEEYYSSLSLKEIHILEFDETVEPKRLLFDFLLITDKWMEERLNSPQDVEHYAFVEGKIIYDPTGKLKEWTKKIAQYPEEEHEIRLKAKYMQWRESVGFGLVNEKRGFETNKNVNLHRAVLAAIHLWFTIKKSWTPPLKWWSFHAKKLGMDNNIYTLFEKIINNPDLEDMKKLDSMFKEMIKESGFDFIENMYEVYMEYYRANRSEAFHRHMYL